jgi:hypothetical protein
MPRKRRYPKARRNTAAELQAWGPVFERGPYLAGDELARIAAVLGEDWEEAPHPEKAWQLTKRIPAEAREPWKRLGRMYMAMRNPRLHNFPLPWAWEEWGPPPGCEHLPIRGGWYRDGQWRGPSGEGTQR